MIERIWRTLAQILYDRNDLINTIKPFFVNLKNENINDEKFNPLLKTFSKYQLLALYQNGIITKQKFNSLIPNVPNLYTNDKPQIERIISGDKINELQKLYQEKNIKTFNIIIKPFREVVKMKIPLIQYSIMKNAIECFKYLLVNGYDDPNKTMEEDNPNSANYNWKNEHRYQWNCMATAIYFGNNEIIKILENRRAENRQNLTYIEAAILSYRNANVTKILDELQNSDEFKNYLNTGFLAAAKSNNLKEAEILLSKGARINIKDIIYLYIKIIFFFTIIKNK